MDYLISLDEQLLLAINSWNNGFWDSFMYLVTDKWIWVPLYLSILYAIYSRYGWRTALLVLVMMALAITAADQICSHLIRPVAQRLRPTNPDNPLSQFVHVVNGYRSGRYGFPSSHAGNTFAAAMLTAMVLKRCRYTLFIFVWAALVCYSRMYLGVHYPGDILVGTAVGLAVGYLFYLLAGASLGWLNSRLTPQRRLPDFRHEPGNGYRSTTLQPSDIPIIIGLLTLAGIGIASAI